MQGLNSKIAATVSFDEGLRLHMSRTYSLLFYGLLVTTATAFGVLNSPVFDMLRNQEGNLTGLGVVATFAPLALLLLAMWTNVGSNSASARILYWAFVFLQGASLALTVSHYTGGSVVNAAAASAAVFGAASLYGYTTKRSLASLGAFLFMGLVGLIAVALINAFLASPAIDWAISCAAVLIFTGLTAWDTQEVKNNYHAGQSAEDLEQARYMSALSLYLNVINLFVSLLRLFGYGK